MNSRQFGCSGRTNRDADTTAHEAYGEQSTFSAQLG
jgi:hypothetical protein